MTLARAALVGAWLLAPAAADAAPSRPFDEIKPAIYARKDWGAELSDRIPLDKVKTRIVVHHTAFFVSDAVKAMGPKDGWKAAIAHAHSAQSLHKRIRGWSDVGYHYMIDWEGRILEGRPVDRLGAHTERNNRGSIGVVLMGNFSRERPTDKQLARLKVLLRWLLAVHRISPKAIDGHHHLKYTACPGKYLNDPWDPLTPLRTIKTALVIETIQANPATRNR